MGKKIIVAGLGHGGIAAAAILSKNGYDVTVYEMKSEGTLGYDWTDIFAPGAFRYAGIPMPPTDLFEYKENMTFYNPSMTVGLTQRVPSDKLEIKMERRDIYNHLIAFAQKCGVKIIYDCKISAPIMLGNRIVGIKTEKGDFYGDLVIDACGMNSPVRMNLPGSIPVEKQVKRMEKISIFRGFYNKASNNNDGENFKVMLFPDNIKGISWVASEAEYTDLLIGKFEDFNVEDVNRLADYLRKRNPSLGSEIVRGGEFVEIPVRQPLSVMVWNGYAAIGDSAFMTVPLIGSGIANCLKAARILSDTIMKDRNGEYSCGTLWNYQREYYKRLGRGFAPLAAAKLQLLQFTPKDIDYFFEAGVLNADNITMTADFSSMFDLVKFDVKDLINKAVLVCKNKQLIKKLLKCGGKISAVMVCCSAIPVKWNEKAVRKWAASYEACFK